MKESKDKGKKLSEKQKAALERLRERALKPLVKEEPKEEKEGLWACFLRPLSHSKWPFIASLFGSSRTPS